MTGDHRVRDRLAPHRRRDAEAHPDHADARRHDDARKRTEEGGVDELVAAAVEGDRAALARLLEVLRPLVLRVCRARLRGRDHGEAEDAAQEALIAVLRSLPRYRDQGRGFLAWVHGIVVHKITDARRAAGRHPFEAIEPPETADSTPGPEDLALHRETAARLRQVLDVLPPRQRDIVVLRVAVGLSAAETAEAVGSSPGAVRVAQHRALSTLRTRARELLPEEPGLLREDLRSDFARAPVTGDPHLDALLADADAALGELGR